MENILCPYGCGKIIWNCNCSNIVLWQKKIVKEVENLKIEHERRGQTGPVGSTGSPWWIQNIFQVRINDGEN